MGIDDFNENYKNYKNLIDGRLSQYIAREIKDIDCYGNSFIKEIHTLIGDYLTNGGKRLRPILSLVFYEAFTDIPPSIEIQNACLLFEFFHNYTLIHDDIYDEDSIRRSREAIHYSLKKWIQSSSPLLFNKKQDIYKDPIERFSAVGGFIAGKLTYNLAQKLLNKVAIDDDIKMNGYNLLAEVYDIDNIGQALDLYFEYGLEEVKEEDYFTMIHLKTCRLIINSALWGAKLARAEEPILDQVEQFALLFGEAFQIHDDIIDIDEYSFKGHSFGSDLKQ